MKPDWKAELKTPKGEPILHGKEPATLADIAYNLLLLKDGRVELPEGEGLKRARLAHKICSEESAEITLDEANKIRKLVDKYESPSVIFAVEELLDPAKKD
jgi:hypothetical protein